ncbi:3-dehydroquinate synthase [Staphylococcus argensis]|uniref:3-dehydroquinate synthase n=1 Tax=Staphylococcus argensis TaxID=1607738 RepID=A0A2K4FF52_9STAP|nr:3-dehydroquinate synthase [Staphylococcus argensis]POA10000.1 3-dehydroquinate synthase [Staphylococcus argensis]
MQLTTTYPDRNYPIVIAPHALDQLDDYIKDYKTKFLFVDNNIYRLWSERIQSIADQWNIKVYPLPAGEEMKTLEHYSQVIESLLAHQITRNTCILAMGGGATGDFSGFVASTLLRGVDYIQIPTTLLAHDSSIGGKVAINSSHGKNLIGAFYRPSAVLYDLDFLQTLPYSEILSGYAEVYKHALLDSARAVQDVENAYPNQQALAEMNDIETYLYRGVETKLQFVIADERESGVRQYLNLGHTFGHAVEYRYHLPHGHAIAIGLLYQFIMSNLIYGTAFDITHYVRYFQQIAYPLQRIKDFEFEPLYQLMLVDKKNNDQGVQMVLLKDIGQPTTHHVTKAELEQAFAELQKVIKE